MQNETHEALIREVRKNAQGREAFSLSAPYLKNPTHFWKTAATKAELAQVAALDKRLIEMTASVKPLLADLAELRKKRHRIVLRASSRSSYRRGVIPSGAERARRRKERERAEAEKPNMIARKVA